jgi:hypothetical protein
MLFFPYQAEPITASVPPSLPSGTTVRWRPLVPVRVIAPSGQSRSYTRAMAGRWHMAHLVVSSIGRSCDGLQGWRRGVAMQTGTTDHRVLGLACQ